MFPLTKICNLYNSVPNMVYNCSVAVLETIFNTYFGIVKQYGEIKIDKYNSDWMLISFDNNSFQIIRMISEITGINNIFVVQVFQAVANLVRLGKIDLKYLSPLTDLNIDQSSDEVDPSFLDKIFNSVNNKIYLVGGVGLLILIYSISRKGK